MVLLLIRGDLRRCQAEIPLIPLFRFAEPACGSLQSLSAASRLLTTKRRLVRYTVEPPTPTLVAISSSLAPASAASKICARLNLGAACLPPLRSAVSAPRSRTSRVHPATAGRCPQHRNAR